MIDGVRLRLLDPHLDDRGSLTELLRSDWEEFPGFGQTTLTRNLPGVVRAWHWHERQTDVFVVIGGTMKIVLHDARTTSPTRGQVQEIVLGAERLGLLVVPPNVLHGYRTVSADLGMILNFPDRIYDAEAPDEKRIPFDSDRVPYRWDP